MKSFVKFFFITFLMAFLICSVSAQDAADFTISSTCGQYSLEEINDVLEDKGFLMIGARQK